MSANISTLNIRGGRNRGSAGNRRRSGAWKMSPDGLRAPPQVKSRSTGKAERNRKKKTDQNIENTKQQLLQMHIFFKFGNRFRLPELCFDQFFKFTIYYHFFLFPSSLKCVLSFFVFNSSKTLTLKVFCTVTAFNLTVDVASDH